MKRSSRLISCQIANLGIKAYSVKVTVKFIVCRLSIMKHQEKDFNDIVMKSDLYFHQSSIVFRC